MSIDEVIDYWNKRPCNINHSKKELGSKEYFNEVTKRKYFVEQHILDFANFKEWNNKDVLEVGCGIGTAAHSFIENGANYKGMDISIKSLELAKKRFEVFDLKGSLVNDNIEKYVDDKKYDLVYSFGVLHHTTDTKKAIDNIYSLLKPNGTLKRCLVPGYYDLRYGQYLRTTIARSRLPPET